MRINIFLFLALLPVAFGFSVNLNAQASENDLDQVELVKRFIGTWTVPTGIDTTMFWECIPSNNGYELNVSWRTKGKTYLTVPALIGFTQDYKHIVMSHLFPSGALTKEIGEFVSDNKVHLERYSADHKHVTSTIEIQFIAPDKFRATYKWRGMKDSWDEAEVFEEIYTKVKK